MAEEDVIFGKHRHLFGGMEPSNMKIFSVISATDAGISLKCLLPDPTVIENQKICSIGGAVIRRKSDSYPVDEFDGDFVADISESGNVVDVVGDITQTYYYAAFPYSTQGVYNRNSANRFKYVYDPCDAMNSFTASYNVTYIVITGDFTSTNITHGVICRSTTGYPVDEFDGTVVGTWDNSSKTFSIDDADVQRGTTYYYTAFPKNLNENVNYSDSNKAVVEIPNYTYLYGFDLNESDSNPDTRVSYPSDVENASYAAAKMGSTSFSYGSWPSTPGEKFMPRPCMLKFDGTVDYYLDPNDYSKRVDGASSDVYKSSYGGNAMVEWPKIYTKRWEENGVYHFRCSDAKLDPDYECWCNYDRLNNEIPHFYTAIYDGYISSEKLRSLSSFTGTPYETMLTYISAAAKNGDDWHIGVISDTFLIQDLLVMMFKSTNLQAALGNGPSGKGDVLAGGNLNNSGLFYGCSSNQTSSVKCFGMENLWGNIDRMTSGLVTTPTKMYKIKLTRGTKDGSTVSDYNATGDGYISTGVSVSSSGYVTKMAVKPYGRLHTHSTNGSSSTYESDWSSCNDSYTHIPIYGGNCGYNYSSGPFCCSLAYTASEKGNSRTGATLSCKPLASIQNA